MPRQCDNADKVSDTKCPLDPYIVMPDSSSYVDQQVWPRPLLAGCGYLAGWLAVGSGSSCRRRRIWFLRARCRGIFPSPQVRAAITNANQCQCHAERYLAGVVKPGTRVTVVGIFSVFSAKVSR